MNSFNNILTYPSGTFFVYVKTKKTDPFCINTEIRSVYLVITEFNLRAFEVTLKRKKAGFLPLREKSDLLVSLDVEINPRFYRGIVNERSDNRKGELDASRKTLKREEPPV